MLYLRHVATIRFVSSNVPMPIVSGTVVSPPLHAIWKSRIMSRSVSPPSFRQRSSAFVAHAMSPFRYWPRPMPMTNSSTVYRVPRPKHWSSHVPQPKRVNGVASRWVASLHRCFNGMCVIVYSAKVNWSRIRVPIPMTCVNVHPMSFIATAL